MKLTPNVKQEFLAEFAEYMQACYGGQLLGSTQFKEVKQAYFSGMLSSVLRDPEHTHVAKGMALESILKDNGSL